jgi:hypothetical protein
MPSVFAGGWQGEDGVASDRVPAHLTGDMVTAKFQSYPQFASLDCLLRGFVSN